MTAQMLIIVIVITHIMVILIRVTAVFIPHFGEIHSIPIIGIIHITGDMIHFSIIRSFIIPIMESGSEMGSTTDLDTMDIYMEGTEMGLIH